MLFSLQNKKAAITGGGSGIGQAIALLFAQQGAEVHILELSADAGADTLAQTQVAGGSAQVHACDVSDAAQVRAAYATIGGFDILVNNAGVAHIGNAENTLEEDFDRIVRINIKGVYNCIHAAIPEMKARGGGVILNMASIAAHVGLADRFAYSMSKAAVQNMTLTVANDFIRDGIRCNSISPARVHTPFVDGFLAKNYAGREEEMFEKLSQSQPIGRMARPDEVAALALYLCSDEAAFITGCDYPIDGGFIHLRNV
jgi:2-keto-3-deoxy-L-fuconate dehydrogenase